MPRKNVFWKMQSYKNILEFLCVHTYILSRKENVLFHCYRLILPFVEQDGEGVEAFCQASTFFYFLPSFPTNIPTDKTNFSFLVAFLLKKLDKRRSSGRIAYRQMKKKSHLFPACLANILFVHFVYESIGHFISQAKNFWGK